MKNKLFFISTVLFVASFTTLHAQNNVNVDNLGFYYKEWQMPKQRLNPPFFVYKTQVEVPPPVTELMDTYLLDDMFIIAGQEKVYEGDGPNMVYARLVTGLPVIKEVNTRNRIEEIKNKKTKEVTKISYFWLEITYTYEDNLQVVQNKKTMLNKPLKKGAFTYKTKEFDTRHEVSEFWKFNKDIVRGNIVTLSTEQSVNEASATLSQLYGFPGIVEKRDIIKTINEKKHPENNILRQNSATLKALLETTMDGYTPLDKNDVDYLIEYFRNIPVRYSDPNSKADKNLRYVAYYNLCKIYAYLDQPDNMIEYANLIAKNGYDPKDGERMVKLALDIRKHLSDFYPYISRSQFNPEDISSSNTSYNTGLRTSSEKIKRTMKSDRKIN